MTSLLQQLTTLLPVLGRPPIRLPLFSYAVAAGFPSSVDDYIEGQLSLDEHLTDHKEATCILRCTLCEAWRGCLSA